MEQQKNTGMARTPKSSSVEDIVVEMGENGIVRITVPDDLSVYMTQTGSSDDVYMHLKNRTVYDIDGDSKISVLTDRKHKHRRYTRDGEKRRHYTWGI